MALLAKGASMRSRDVLEPSWRNRRAALAAVFATSIGIELSLNGSDRRHPHQVRLIWGRDRSTLHHHGTEWAAL